MHYHTRIRYVVSDKLPLLTDYPLHGRTSALLTVNRRPGGLSVHTFVVLAYEPLTVFQSIQPNLAADVCTRCYLTCIHGWYSTLWRGSTFTKSYRNYDASRLSNNNQSTVCHDRHYRSRSTRLGVLSLLWNSSSIQSTTERGLTPVNYRFLCASTPLVDLVWKGWAEAGVNSILAHRGLTASDFQEFRGSHRHICTFDSDVPQCLTATDSLTRCRRYYWTPRLRLYSSFGFLRTQRQLV